MQDIKIKQRNYLNEIYSLQKVTRLRLKVALIVTFLFFATFQVLSPFGTVFEPKKAVAEEEFIGGDNYGEEEPASNEEEVTDTEETVTTSGTSGTNSNRSTNINSTLTNSGVNINSSIMNYVLAIICFAILSLSIKRTKYSYLLFK